VFAQKVDRYSVFPAQIKRPRAYRAGPKETDGFQVMNGDRQFAGLESSLPCPLAHGHVFWIHRHFHAQSEVVTRHIASGHEQVKGVLLNLAHGPCLIVYV
jgi:hypothetical protein